MRWMFVAALMATAGFAQDDDDDGCGETEILVDGGADGEIAITVDPYADEQAEIFDANRPPSVRVGTWPAPELEPDARTALARLLVARDLAPADKHHRYRLADFYLAHKWYPHAEHEYLAAARLDPESIRPWAALLRLYATSVAPQNTRIFINFGPNIVERFRSDTDWLPSALERNVRVSHAYREMLKRRPDEIQRRRDFVAHLRAMGDVEAMAAQAREALRQLPDDADMRYHLAESLRKQAAEREPDSQGLKDPLWAQARRELEETVKRRPNHVKSVLRLIRMLCHEEGNDAEERISRLENRAFFQLFVLKDIAPLAYRADAVRMAKSLSGARIASRLWDDAMAPEELNRWNPDRRFFDRWVFLAFPHSAAGDRAHAIDALARRGDPAVAALLLALLWHTDDQGAIEARALVAAGGLGPAGYAGAQRFLLKADTPLRRRRGVHLLRLLGDRRAVQPLIKTLATDKQEKFALGTAAALESLGDGRAIDGLVAAALDVQRPSVRRREAVEALAVFRDPRSIEVVKRLAKDPEFDLICAYAQFRLTGDTAALQAMRQLMVAEGLAAEALRLARKCESPSIEGLCYDVLEKCTTDTRPAAVALLKERFWPQAKGRLRAFFLKQANSPDPMPFTLSMLGELGGDAVVGRLLTLLGQARDDDRWERFARALAQTGDDRAVRHFNRMRILARSDRRRVLARQLHEVAAKRRTQLAKQN